MMMKKWMITLLCLVLLTGCGSKAVDKKEEPSSTPAPAEESSIEESSTAESSSEESSVEESSTKESSTQYTRPTETEIPEVDGVLDLTQLSSTMVYAEVYNMVMSPNEYAGKTIRMKGSYYSFFDEASQTWYTACVIPDAAGCCQQGLEFHLTDDYAFPEDYPEENKTIVVQGIFTEVQMENYYYFIIDDAVLL